LPLPGVKLNSQMQMFEVNEKQEYRSNAPDRHSGGQFNWVAIFSVRKASMMSPFFTSL
jgi:hypothetical protein